MIIYREAKDTITPVELDIGDTLKFRLRNGQVRTLTLENTSARIILTNKLDVKDESYPGGTIYSFSCDVKIDGLPMRMERYVCSQESFYEPYVIGGMRIWFDAVADIFDLIVETHGTCRPNKKARFAVNDVNDPICPQEIQLWCPLDERGIDIHDCYDGDDCWLGPYRGTSAHGGLDINHPKGTPLWAPIDFDDQFYFNSIKQGHNNNRWRAIRYWPDGSVWILQTAHMVKLLVPEHVPIKAGTHYAEAAGELVGSHEHSHFAFRITEEDSDYLLDPWIIFWQMLKNLKEKNSSLQAKMAPVYSREAGEKIQFTYTGMKNNENIKFYWDFGDGCRSREENPQHVFAKKGIYPVTLTVDDGKCRDVYTQHVIIRGIDRITVYGVVPDPDMPSLMLDMEGEPAFRKRPAYVMNVYGRVPDILPGCLKIISTPENPYTRERIVNICNNGGGVLPEAQVSVRYLHGSGWIETLKTGHGNRQQLKILVNPMGLPPGNYEAIIEVECKGIDNSPQTMTINLVVAEIPETSIAVVDDQDEGFYATPYFWVGHKFHSWWDKKGYGGFYLTNGGRADEGEFVRFTPVLREGKYKVSFSDQTPFKAGDRFIVHIKHKRRRTVKVMEPFYSLEIGTFEFSEGNEGFVEIWAGGSQGNVLADAVIFQREDD